MSDPIKPDRLKSTYKPAVIEFRDGEKIFVAHTRVKESGWLYALSWNGERQKLSPHAVIGYTFAETELYHEERDRGTVDYQRLVDDDLRERARELAGLEVAHA